MLSAFVTLLLLAQTFPATAPVETGRIQSKELSEPSGLMRSRSAEVYWTHNDGNDRVLYAIRVDGSLVTKIPVDAKIRDWEDIAADDAGNLYLADTGNNGENRKKLAVYRIAEPPLEKTEAVKPADAWQLSFDGPAFDCEALFVWQGFGYLVTKVPRGQPAAVLRFSLEPGRKKQVLTHVTDIAVEQPVTAADISPDGKRLVILGRGVLSVFDINGDVSKVGTGQPRVVRIPQLQWEGCCFTADGIAIIAESGEVALVRDENAR